MTLRILLAAALIGFMNTAGAVRVIEQVERPFEITVAQLALPGAVNGLNLAIERHADLQSVRRLQLRIASDGRHDPLPPEPTRGSIRGLRTRVQCGEGQ